MNEKTVNIGQVYLCFLSSDAFVEKQYLFQNDACFQGFRFIVFDSRQIPYFHRSREDLNWNKFRKKPSEIWEGAHFPCVRLYSNDP